MTYQLEQMKLEIDNYVRKILVQWESFRDCTASKLSSTRFFKMLLILKYQNTEILRFSERTCVKI